MSYVYLCYMFYIDLHQNLRVNNVSTNLHENLRITNFIYLILDVCIKSVIHDDKI